MDVRIPARENITVLSQGVIPSYADPILIAVVEPEHSHTLHMYLNPEAIPHIVSAKCTREGYILEFDPQVCRRHTCLVKGHLATLEFFQVWENLPAHKVSSEL